MSRFSLLIFLSFVVACEQATGDYRLSYVQDGDSVVLCCEQGKNFKVRLKDIDAPEKNQPFAEQSRKMLQDLLADKPLQLVGEQYDRYGRRLADIIVNEQSVNSAMIKSGAAWVWRYSDSLKYKWLQKQAKKQSKGLWALPESKRIEPWLWRKKYPYKKK